MKIDGKTIPAPQNIKKREAFLLANKDKFPVGYLHDELLRIADTRVSKGLNWDSKEPVKPLTPIAQIVELKKQGFIDKMKNAIKRGH